MESPCRHIRMEVLEQRFGDRPDFRRARISLDRLSREMDEESKTERLITDCYGKHLDRLHDVLNTLTTDQITERYAQLKSDLFSTSMAFFSSISEQLGQYLRRVKAQLRTLPTNIKRHLLNYMQDLWIEKVYPIIQAFVNKLDNVARQLGVDSYSVSLNYAFIEVSFSFKPAFKK